VFGDFVHQIPVRPNDKLKVGWDCEGDMLPCRARESVVCFRNPLVGGLLAAGGAELGFACVRGAVGEAACLAEELVESEEVCTANQHFKHVDDDRIADKGSMTDEELPPVPIVYEDVPEPDFAANVLHMSWKLLYTKICLQQKAAAATAA
jgi:hypothetical protein